MDFKDIWVNDLTVDRDWIEDNNTIVDNGEGENIIFPILYNEFLS